VTINYTAPSALPRFGAIVSPKFSLTEGSIPRALLSFSLPILFGNVLQSINGSVNSVWVGKFLGAASLAAVGNSNVVMFLLFGLMFGFSMASTIMVAQCVGARNIAEAKRVVGTSAVFFLGLSLAMSLTGFALAQSLVDWLRTPPDALPLALTYMRVIFLALPFMGGLFFLMAVLRGAGDSRTPFVYLFMSVVLDIALNPLLIFGWGPVPRLGIAGSAIATLIAQALSFFALVAHLYRTGHFLCIRSDELSLFNLDWRLVRILVAKGIPMGLHLFVVSSSMIALTSLVNRFGSEETAAFNAAMQLWNYVQMPALAIGAAASSMAAQNVGAGKWDRVGKIATTGVTFNLLIGGSLIAIVYALNPAKDVDGLHPVNVGKLAIGDPTALVSCTPLGCQRLLLDSGIDPAGAHVVIVGRSMLVGKPLALLLMQKRRGGDATVTVAHSRSRDLTEITRSADILVAAIGRSQFLRADHVREGAVVIDVGINRVKDDTRPSGFRLVGDVAFDEVAKRAKAITPVPGGVGPMTIAMLMQNTVSACQHQTGIAG